MTSNFRSRGIRILCDKGNLVSKQEKIYFEPSDHCQIQNEQILQWQEKGLISLFEYSVVQNSIDTYNFHVNLARDDYRNIYKYLPDMVLNEFRMVSLIFDQSFRNYTVGYRLDNARLINQSFYFYPTIWKEFRYGIKGITDIKKINKYVNDFSKWVASGNADCRDEINEFASIIYKLKGISIHVDENVIGYKLYGRVQENDLKCFIKQRTGYDISENSHYGTSVLVALRVSCKMIKGYNIYYLS